MEIVQRICHECRKNSVAFSMLPAEGSIITANYVPNAGKATASAFRKWDESSSYGSRECAGTDCDDSVSLLLDGVDAAVVLGS